MKKIIILILIITLIGCNGTRRPITNPTEINTGTDGINLDFQKNYPPTELIEDQDFAISLILENKGAQDISNGYISLITEQEYIEIIEWQGTNPITTLLSEFSAEGKSQYNPKGEIKPVTILLRSKKLKPMEETHTVFFGITTCYPYKTTYSASVCIDPDPLELRQQEKVCEMETISSSGQGAPVSVSEITPLFKTEGNQIFPRFKLKIENKGNGEVIKEGKEKAACSSQGLEKTDIGSVMISSIKMPDLEFECQPNPIIIREGTATTMCTSKEGMEREFSAYTTTLMIELDYSYTTTISQETRIGSLEAQNI